MQPTHFHYPAQRALTPHDTNAMPIIHALYVTGTGNVTVVPALPNGATAVLYSAVPANSYLYGPFARVKATGTTATGLIALGPA